MTSSDTSQATEKRMTKREINETITNINAALAIARWNIQHNDFPQALAQLMSANMLVLLATTRMETYSRQ